MPEYPKVSSLEKRTPRDKFTNALIRVCRRLDERAKFEIVDNDSFTRRFCILGESAPEPVEITALWVVGSYARGAPTCGDLDVVVDTKRTDGQPRRVSYARLVKPAFGQIAHLRVYEGTPEKNNSGVSFPNSILIWSHGLDWLHAISSIKVDPAAQRFERDGDIVPLRAEQLDGGIRTVDDLTKCHQRGELAWRFLPFDFAAGLGEPTAFERRLLECYSWGRKTKALIPYVLRYLRENLCIDLEQVSDSDVATLNIHGVHIAMGRPYPDYHKLDSLDFSRVLAIPHLSSRGPNGIWELRRGTNHGLVKAFAEVSAYVHQCPNGKLSLIHVSGVNKYIGAYELQLFRTKERAREEIEIWNDTSDDSVDDEDQLRIVRMTGSEILDAISCADTLEIEEAEGGSSVFHLTYAGASNDREELEGPFIAPDSNDVASALSTKGAVVDIESESVDACR
jgi:hypothetical protein